MSFSCVLFDLDGTLLHTADDLGAALNFVLSEHGIAPVSADRYTAEASNGAKAMLKLGFAESFDDYDFDQLREQFLQHYLQNIALHSCYYDEVIEVLTFLNQRKIPWGIVTNKPEFLTLPLLEHFTLLKQCGAIVSGDTVGVAKPDPRPIFHALKQLEAMPEQSIYVGDAERDICAGKNAGTATAAALYGYIDKAEDVTLWQADYHIQSPIDLIDLMVNTALIRK